MGGNGMKTAEEILDFHLNKLLLTDKKVFVSLDEMKRQPEYQVMLEAMQEFAYLYHKEKLREELRLYDEYLDEHVENEKSKVCKIKRFSDYLKTKE
jgi:hypothetical protein